MERKKLRKILNQKILQLSDIMADLDHILTHIDNEFFRVCIFGSARLKEGTPYYQQVYDLAFYLSQKGIDIVTGGGPGLMEAANKGAKDGCNKSRSIGLPIELPFESDANNHLDVKRHHRRFSTRLDEFMRISQAVIVTPGGIGTVLELVYTWQLLQVDHIAKRPIILLGKKMWEGFIQWLKQEPLSHQLLSPDDIQNLTIADSIDEVWNILKPDYERFKLNNPR